jgi:hypothetical protein
VQSDLRAALLELLSELSAAKLPADRWAQVSVLLDSVGDGLARRDDAALATALDELDVVLSLRVVPLGSDESHLVPASEAHRERLTDLVRRLGLPDEDPGKGRRNDGPGR